MYDMEGAGMLSLKSKKLSLGLLAIFVSIDCYVELQRSASDMTSMADTSSNAQLAPHLPTLRIVTMSPLFMSGKLFGFTDDGNGTPSFQELQSLLYTTPLHFDLNQLIRHEPAAQIVELEQANQQTNLDASFMASQSGADGKDASEEVTKETLPPVQVQTKTERPQAMNLMKLLALYSMLHR
jgi:hypothetical protein